MTQEAQSPDALMSALDRASQGLPPTNADRALLEEYDRKLETEGEGTTPLLKTELQAIRTAHETNADNLPTLLDAFIRKAHPQELQVLRDENIITEEAYKAELARRKPKKETGDDQQGSTATGPSTGQPTETLDELLKRATGVERDERNMSMADAQQWITENVPAAHQNGLIKELEILRKSGRRYDVSISRNWRGTYKIVSFRKPQPWEQVKKDAAQSVTREVRRETGKQINRLLNPDYAHNEMIREYRLVREALPQGSATRQALDKVDRAVKILLTTSGITAEAANLLVNAIRGALLEAPELKYKIAALLPDDVVRQGYVVAARSAGNTLRRYIHEKYHLPDRPKQTPVLVNTLDQIKPEHYRAQDAQKVGVDMRDLNREKAREFILKNVPVEKQASALETIDRLPGNTFGVQIMDAGWVRISASAREPRKYEDRPKYDNRQRWVGSYNATDDTKMP